MNGVFVLNGASPQTPPRVRRKRDLSATAWTACCVTLALALLFVFFFRMEESVAQQLDVSVGTDAEWAQRHWQCSAVPVMKQAVCEERLAEVEQAGQVETADASR